MAAEYMDEWAPSAKEAAHIGLRDVLDGASGNAFITVHRNDDSLLATLELQRPCATVDSLTGQFTALIGDREENAPNGGFADYATLRNSSGDAVRSMECVQGSEPVPGKCVLNTLQIELGGRVELVSFIVV